MSRELGNAVQYQDIVAARRHPGADPHQQAAGEVLKPKE